MDDLAYKKLEHDAYLIITLRFLRGSPLNLIGIEREFREKIPGYRHRSINTNYMLERLGFYRMTTA